MDLDNDKKIQNGIQKKSIYEDEPSSIRILEHKLRRLEKEMEKYDSTEMTLNDMEKDDSFYMRKDFIVKKYIKHWKRYRCLIQKSDGRAKIYKKLTVSSSKYPQINEAVKKHLTSKKKFPDYPEIRHIVSETNKNFNLGLTPALLKFESSEIFHEVGLQLQKQRKLAITHNMATFVESSDLNKLNTEDPANNDEQLNLMLTTSSEKFSKEMDTIFRDYAIKSLEEIPSQSEHNESDGSETNLTEPSNSSSNESDGVQKEKSK